MKHGSCEKEWAHQHAEGTEHCEVGLAVVQICIENEPTNKPRSGHCRNMHLVIVTYPQNLSFHWCFEVGLDLLYVPEWRITTQIIFIVSYDGSGIDNVRQQYVYVHAYFAAYVTM